MDFVWPLVRSTTVISFEPSLVTYAVLPSLDVVAQCGCLPTATLRTGLVVPRANKSSSLCHCDSTARAWSLHDDDAECRGARITYEMRRYARRNLRDDLVGRRVKHLNRADPGLG